LELVMSHLHLKNSYALIGKKRNKRDPTESDVPRIYTCETCEEDFGPLEVTVGIL